MRACYLVVNRESHCLEGSAASTGEEKPLVTGGAVVIGPAPLGRGVGRTQRADSIEEKQVDAILENNFAVHVVRDSKDAAGKPPLGPLVRPYQYDVTDAHGLKLASGRKRHDGDGVVACAEDYRAERGFGCVA